MAGRVHEWNLGDRLRAAREEAGYGQREFAARTGISRGSISSYENGTTTPRRPAILAWAEATGFDPGWLESGKSQWELVAAHGSGAALPVMPCARARDVRHGPEVAQQGTGASGARSAS